MRKQFFIWGGILGFLLLGTIIAVVYGSGYKFGFERGRPELAGTGLLVATSKPNGAQVFINDHLTTATDNTINLAPGQYDVRIFKEGYFPWKKKIVIQKEVVSKADALLFPTTPRLEGITTLGAQNPVIDPSFSKLAYTVASQSARKNGIYVLDMSTKPIITLQNASSQVADDTADVFSQAKLSWSPDGKQIMATIASAQNPSQETTYLLDANSMNENPQDITTTLESVLITWQTERKQKEFSRIAGLPTKLKNSILNDFSVLNWSPDDTKILYQATHSATIPNIIKPAVISTNSTGEERTLQKDAVYVYDIKEDKNYKLFSSLTNPEISLMWLPDSSHLIVVRNKRIEVIEYDGINPTTISAFPFVDNYVFPWPNGSKIVILTNLGNPDITENLYTISLK